MKSLKTILRTAGPALAMAVLILDAKTALAGAQSGVELCIRTVIPSLFPFLFLSAMITGSLMGKLIPFLRPIGKLCRIPAGAESLLAVGLLGGYPVGAQCVAQTYRDGQLSKADATRMLGFCSNAGPSFLFGMLAGAFSDTMTVWALWGIHILSALMTGMLLPGGSNTSVRSSFAPVPSPATALRQSITVMAGICGWVVVFRVLIAFCQRWFIWALPTEAGIAMTGLMELANGCCQLSLVEQEGLRFLLAALLLGCGGFCVFLQTVSVTADLGIGLYFPGKLVQGSVSCMLACLAQPLLFPQDARVSMPIYLWCVPLIAALTWGLFAKHSKNSSSILARKGV